MADPTRLDRDDIATREAHHSQHTMPTKLDATPLGGGDAPGTSAREDPQQHFSHFPTLWLRRATRQSKGWVHHRQRRMSGRAALRTGAWWQSRCTFTRHGKTR